MNQRSIQDKLLFRPLIIQGNLSLNQNRTANIWDILMSAQSNQINITAILFSINPLINFYLRYIQLRAKIMRPSKLTFNILNLQKTPIKTLKIVLL